MASTDTLKCPFKTSSTTDLGIQCEGALCAAWNDVAGECILLQAALALIDKTSGDIESGNRARHGL